MAPRGQVVRAVASIALAVPMVLIAYASGDGDADADVAPLPTAWTTTSTAGSGRDADPSPESPTTEVSDPPPTSMTGATAAGGAAVVMSALESSSGTTRIVGHGDGFVSLAVTDGDVVVSRSADGTTFAPVPSDLVLGTVLDLGSDGSRLGAVGHPRGAGGPVNAWTSTDDGATWTGGPVPLADGTGSTAIAVGRGIVVVANVGFGPDALAGPTLSLWVWGGRMWDPVDVPALHAPNTGVANLVAGPAGFLLISPAEDQLGGPVVHEALRSRDGRTWETVPLGGAFTGTSTPILAGGPLGYLAVDLDGNTVHHSGDGATWTEVHRFPDLDPDVIGYSRSRPAAGGAGFAIPLVVLPRGDAPGGAPWSARVLWSPGGNRWEELTPHGVDTVVAVSATALLMAPYPAAERTGPSRDDITRWVEETLVPLADIDPGDVSCLTDDLAAVGAVRPQLDDDPDGSEQARRTGAERYVDVFVDCTSRWEHVFLLTRTEGADQISQPSANCVTDALDDDTARSMWIEEMVGASNDLRHLDPLFDTLDQCLTVEELDRLDWN